MEGNLARILNSHLIDIIDVSLEVTNDGTFHYEVINYEEKVSVPEGTGIFMPELKCRIYIPQDHFIDYQRIKKPESSFTVTWNKSVLNLSDQVTINVNHDHTTNLTMLHT